MQRWSSAYFEGSKIIPLYVVVIKVIQLQLVSTTTYFAKNVFEVCHGFQCQGAAATLSEGIIQMKN